MCTPPHRAQLEPLTAALMAGTADRATLARALRALGEPGENALLQVSSRGERRGRGKRDEDTGMTHDQYSTTAHTQLDTI